MPKFILKLKVINNKDTPIRTYIGASLVGVSNQIEYYNEADDIQWTFQPGENIVQRYLTTDLGQNQKYNLYVALWDIAKPIGQGTKYAAAMVPNAVEKKKKVVLNMKVSVLDYYPRVFFGE